jgi:hypothetical protein
VMHILLSELIPNTTKPRQKTDSLKQIPVSEEIR